MEWFHTHGPEAYGRRFYQVVTDPQLIASATGSVKPVADVDAGHRAERSGPVVDY